jgi:lysophospholipase L1-like esterase
MNKVFEFEDAYRALAAEPAYAGRVSVISLAGQYDTAYNSITAEMPVNNRNQKTEAVQSNGVHCSDNGYRQIADAIYRYMATRLQ